MGRVFTEEHKDNLKASRRKRSPLTPEQRRRIGDGVRRAHVTRRAAAAQARARAQEGRQ